MTFYGSGLTGRGDLRRRFNPKHATIPGMSPARSIAIPESELTFAFARSGGPGGQNVNKVETKVIVAFDFMSSSSLSWEEKGRIGKHPAIQSRLDADGALAVSSQAHRTQALNKRAAIEKLHELLALALRPVRKRIPTKKTRGSQRRRLEGKRLRKDTKVTRRKVSLDG
jgi:ribosome-associated protein